MKTNQQDDYTRIDIRLISIYQLLRWNQSGILKTDLPWLRNFRWAQYNKSILIESILMGIPIQTLFLKEQDGEIEVIDGVQRIKTILSFLNDEFPVLSENKEWNGLKYSGLSNLDQRRIEDFQLSAYVLHNDESGEIQNRIFRNLNLSREEFTSQEKRNYFYAEKGMPYIKELSKNNYYLNTIQNKDIDFAAYQEYELVLRFMSFYYKGYEGYTGNIKGFIDDTLKNYEEYRLNEERFRKVFERVFHTIWDVWKKEAFLVGSGKRKLNFAMFDVITYSCAKFSRNKILKHREQIQKLPEKLLNHDREFRRAVTGASTTSVENVRNRFSIWMKEMEKEIGEKHD